MTTTSEYNPYTGMTVRFLVLLASNGNNIYGSAEKIYEVTADGTKREYEGKDRSIAKIVGHIEKKYLSKDRILIHISEQGEIRQSSTIHILGSENFNNLLGRFYSTIANQQGEVSWTRKSS